MSSIMRVVAWALGGVALACLEGACGKNAEQPSGPRVPLQHRVAAAACDRERPRGGLTSWSFTPSPQAGAATPEDTCIDDADCGGPITSGFCRYRPEVAH